MKENSQQVVDNFFEAPIYSVFEIRILKNGSLELRAQHRKTRFVGTVNCHFSSNSDIKNQDSKLKIGHMH